MNLRNCLLAISALVLIWSAVAAILHAAEKRTSSPDKVRQLMASAPWMNGNDSDATRKQRLQEVIDNVNRLDYEQRRAMNEGDRETGRRFFESLTQEEKVHYLKDTVEQQCKSIMKAFNKMPREERQNLVTKALRDMDRNPNGDPNMEHLRQEDEKAFDSIVEKGLGAYYQDATVETKIDLGPLMEKMQDRLRHVH